MGSHLDKDPGTLPDQSAHGLGKEHGITDISPPVMGIKFLP